MSTIKENLTAIQSQVSRTAETCGRNPADITLIAVSKKKSVEAVKEAIEAGSTNFGENYIQEAIDKIEQIGVDAATWHFIGHLQSNKAKFAVKYFDLIHTVGSVKLAKEINKQAAKNDKVQRILLQVNIGLEQSKSGADPEEVVQLAGKISEFENLSLEGLMGMPPFFADPEDVRPYFKKMASIQAAIVEKQLSGVSMERMSMGMSNDFKVAIQEGSTMVRVGTSIFGSRD